MISKSLLFLSKKINFIYRNDEKAILYENYYFSKHELIKYISQSVLIVFIISYLFYHSYLSVLFLSPFTLFYLKKKQKELIKNRKNELNLQFKDAIISLAGSLNAGYSIENSFRESIKDLILLHGDEALITREFNNIVRQLELNYTVESLFDDLAKRSSIDDIKCFSEVFNAAKRSGGDLISIINSTAASIGEKIDLKHEIYTLMAAKRLEQKIMNVVPFVIILYVNISSPGFLHVLYNNTVGILIMSVCLGIYSGAFWMAERILDVEV